MRCLFFVEPLVMHNRPFHYWAWLGIFAGMCRTLRARGIESRVVVNEALATRALAPLGSGSHYAQRGQGLLPEEVVTLTQSAIRSLFERPNLAILECLERASEPERTRAYAELVRAALGDFEPDVMMSLTPAPQLRAAFPAALLFATETAAYSRAPYPMSVFFDPCGMWADSLPARETEALRARVPAPEETELLAAFRRRFGAYFRAASPFSALEAELRRTRSRLAFLPLQFGGESGFDLNGPFRNQGEYLFDVLERLPGDIALVVVEHPTAHWIGDVIDEETRAYLAERYPHVRFVDFDAVESAGQYLVHHADFVIALSTSLAIQGLFFGRPLVSVGSGHLARWSQLAGVEGLGAGAELRVPASFDGVLGWLLTRYFVPLELTTDADWLEPFLHRSLERFRAGMRGPDFFDAVLPAPALSAILFRGLEAATLGARLQNGDLSRWSRGAGPFPTGAGGPDSWELIDPSGTSSARRGAGPSPGTSAVRLERARGGIGPALFLQRVPDLSQSAGSMARLRFRARADSPLTVTCYFYLQLADGRPCFGAPDRRITLGTHWSEHEYVTKIPEFAPRRPGAGNHLEVVFALPPESGAAAYELAEIALEPVVV
jgi:hypothetical protein